MTVSRAIDRRPWDSAAMRTRSPVPSARATLGGGAVARLTRMVSPRLLAALLAMAFCAQLLAQDADATKPSKPELTPEFFAAAYADAIAACVEVLEVEKESLPPLVLAEREQLATAVASENLPLIQKREPDGKKAKALADQIGQQISISAYAKYSWSTKSTLVVTETWKLQARILRDRSMTGIDVVRAVLVHELCHAVADQKFDLTARLASCDTIDATMAFNAVMEGHAQLLARRVCTKKGWMDGFETFTKAIGAIPDLKVDEATKIQIQAEATSLRSTYHDGEAFATAVVAARPETGEADLFHSPPRDLETVLHPEWYLDPKTRPASLYDTGPALDAFVATFDSEGWTAQRNDVPVKQMGAGMFMMPKEEVDAVLAGIRTGTIVQLNPTDAPQSKAAYLLALEFDSEASARRWIAFSGRVSDAKDDTMDKGRLRITGSKTTAIDQEGIFGLLQEKQMRNGTFDFDVSTIDACAGPVVLESLYSGHPMTADSHIALMKDLLKKVAKR